MNEMQARTSLLDELANGLSTLLARGMEQAFGPGVGHPVIGPVSWADLATALGVVLLLLVAHFLAVAFFRRKTKGGDVVESKDLVWRQFIYALGGPLYSLIWLGGVYVAAMALLRKLLASPEWAAVGQFLSKPGRPRPEASWTNCSCRCWESACASRCR
jgi:hypothetical protein